MKKGIFSMVLAITGVFASAQCEPVNELNENFDTWEEIDACWSTISNGGMIYTDENITFYSFMSPNINMYLISPEIINGDYILKFDAGTFSLGGEQPENVTLEIGTLNAQENNDSYVAVSTTIALDNEFQTIEIPISFSGEAKYFALKISTVTPHSAAGIDNLTLRSATTDTEEIQDHKVQVYPNPMYNQLNLSSAENIQEVNVFTTTGELVRSIKLNETNASVNVSDLKAGVYLVQVKTAKGVQTMKVVKR